MNTNPQRHISTKYIDYGDSSYFGRLAPDGCESRHGPMDRKWERSYSGLSCLFLTHCAAAPIVTHSNRDLTGLTAESSPPPSPKRRARAQSLPMASPHMVPDTAPPPSPPPADDVSEFDDSLPPDSPADGVSVADSFDSSASLDVDFSMLFSASPHSRRGDRIRGKAQASSRKRSKR